MFGPSLRSPELLCPLLTSANPSRHLSITVVRDRLADLPGYCALTFTLMPAAYTLKLSVQVSDFEDIGLLIQLARLYAISVRQASALPAASFRFHLAMDTLAVRLTIPPVGLVEDFHLQVRAPCRAHPYKKEGHSRGPPWFRKLGEEADLLTTA